MPRTSFDPVVPAPAAAQAQRPSGADRSKRERKVQIRLDVASFQAMRLLSVETDTSLQQLGLDAFNMLMKAHGRTDLITAEEVPD